MTSVRLAYTQINLAIGQILLVYRLQLLRNRLECKNLTKSLNHEIEVKET